MHPRFKAAVDVLAKAVLEGRGDSSTRLRAAVYQRSAGFARSATEQPPDTEALPESLGHYVDTVAQHAYKVVDRDIQRLLQAGYSQDAVFELTVSAALGAGLARLECGLKALEGDRE